MMGMTLRDKKVVVLTGAGISAESGVKTFRDNDGLWAVSYTHLTLPTKA